MTNQSDDFSWFVMAGVCMQVFYTGVKDNEKYIPCKWYRTRLPDLQITTSRNQQMNLLVLDAVFS